MKIIANTKEEFFNNSGSHKDTIIELDEFIRKTISNFKCKLYSSDTISTIGYGEIPYKGDVLPIIAIAPQKHNVSLYVMAWKDGISMPEKYQGKLGKTSNGKGCIRFKKFRDLQLDELKNLLMDTYDIYQSIIKKNENK